MYSNQREILKQCSRLIGTKRPERILSGQRGPIWISNAQINSFHHWQSTLKWHKQKRERREMENLQKGRINFLMKNPPRNVLWSKKHEP